MRKELLVILVFVLVSMLTCSFGFPHTNSSAELANGWSKTYGGPDADGAISLVLTSDGGYALAGMTESFGAGGDDFWLVKTDSYGNIKWNQTYGGTNRDYGFCLVQTSDGGYAFAGSTSSLGAGNSDVWLVKTDEHVLFQRITD